MYKKNILLILYIVIVYVKSSSSSSYLMSSLCDLRYYQNLKLKLPTNKQQVSFNSRQWGCVILFNPPPAPPCKGVRHGRSMPFATEVLVPSDHIF